MKDLKGPYKKNKKTFFRSKQNSELEHDSVTENRLKDE